MHNQSYWLDRFKEAKGFTSDYQVGKHWAKNTAQISQIRSGKTKLTFGACLEIAESLQIDPIEILAALEFQRTSDEYERDIIKKHFFSTLRTKFDRHIYDSGIRSVFNGHFKRGFRR